MAFEVPLSAIPILRDPPYVIALFTLGAALGRRLLLLVRAPRSALSRLEYGVVCAALGTGLLQYVVFALGMSGHLTPGAIRVAFAVVALLLGLDLVAVVRALGRGVVDAVTTRRPSVRSWTFWLLLALAPALIVALLRTLTPVTDMDGIGYHLGIPRRWLGVGRMEYVPTMFMAQLPLGQEMLYTAALATWSETAARLIHFAFGLLAFLGVVAIGRRLARPTVGVAVGAVFLVGVPAVSVLELSTWAYTELGIVSETVAALIAWMAWRRTRSSGWLIAAFACAGIALSFKITTGFLALGLSVLTALSARRGGVVRAVGVGAAGFAASLAVFSPWPARAWSLTGNPFFPFLSSVFPTRDWNAEAAHGFTTYFRYYGWGTGRLFGSLDDSERQIVLMAAVVLVAAAAAATVWRARDTNVRAFAALAGLVTAVFVWNTGLYARYLVPVLPLWLVAISVPVSARWKGRSAGYTLVTVTVLGSASYIARSSPSVGEAAAFAVGRGSRQAYLSRCLPTYPMAVYANLHVPSGSLILVSGAAAQYYYDAPLIFMDVVRMRSDAWEHYLDDLKRNGVTHILVSRAFYEQVPAGAALPNRLFFVRRIVAERGTLMLETDSDRLYALRAQP